jgi:hypothetical protein
MAIVTATRNAVDVRKWVASRLMPNQYGDEPSALNNQTNIVTVSEERQRELHAVRQRIFRKVREQLHVNVVLEDGLSKTGRETTNRRGAAN